MPARTNEYQKLVMLINRSLSNSDAKVIESAMLYDSEADCEREVDILIQCSVSGYDLSVGIECTTVARPVEVRVLESCKEKHRKVGVHKTVVVSKSGFTKGSKEYARKNHITLLTFDAAGREKWSKIFERFKETSVYGRSYRLLECYIILDESDQKAEFVFDSSIQAQWEGSFISIHKLCAELWRESGIPVSHSKMLRQNELDGKDPYVEFGINLKKEHTFRDRNGVEIRPSEVGFKLVYESNYQVLNSREVEYDGQTHVVGSFEDKAKRQFAHFSLREQKGRFRGSVEFSTNLIPAIFGSKS